jgi:3-oxoacyl-[acyl-carrier protein] reductase
MSHKACRRALVTGATRGIGLAIAKKLIEQGCEVLSTGTQKNPKTAVGSDYQQVDFTNDVSTKNFLSFLGNNNFDILVNNAGINHIDKFTEIKEDDFNRILEVNLKAPFLISQEVVKKMKESNWGRIINVTSIFSKVSRESRASYSASKFALDGLTAAMSAELSSSNILINSVSPGFIETDLTKEILGKAGIKEIQKTIPIGRLGSVEEIASFVAWLVSEENTYISGQNLVIDGGFIRV